MSFGKIFVRNELWVNAPVAIFFLRRMGELQKYFYTIQVKIELLWIATTLDLQVNHP